MYTLGPKGKAALELRSLASETIRYRRFNPILKDSSIPHQIATNRVADWLGAQLLPEHLLPALDANGARHRPDGIYEAAQPDKSGRTLMLLEVDMGHYSRQRIVGKLAAFLAHPQARGIVFVCPTWERTAWIGRVIREESHRDRVDERITLLTFEQIHKGWRPQTADGRTIDPAPHRDTLWSQL